MDENEGLVETKKMVVTVFSFDFSPQVRIIALRGRAAVARRAHNPEVVGSNPTPATTKFSSKI